MRIKSIAITAVLATAILCFGPATVSAAGLTSTQIQAIIGLLQSFGADATTIANVQTALTGGTPNIPTTTWCHTFTNYLKIGSSRTEVDNLWTALLKSDIPQDVKENLSYDHEGMGQASTFGENTAAAVVAFQAKYGIRQTGTVGPITRAKLNSLYGCRISVNTQPSITSISPNPAVVGQTITVIGKNLSGFEGDKDLWIENSAGQKGIIYANNRAGPDTIIQFTLAGSYCTADTSYSGLPCPSYITITPGTYSIYAAPWGTMSNKVSFSVGLYQ